MPVRSSKRREAHALDAVLRSLFRAVERRPVPDSLRSVVAQLDHHVRKAAPQR